MRPAGKMTVTGLVIVLALAGGFWAAPARGQSLSECMDCHSDAGIAREDGRSVSVSLDTFKKSVHGRADLSCVDCHQDLAGVKDFPHPASLKPIACASCHADADREYQTSIHGQSLARTEKSDAATCASCHGSHDILPAKDPESKLFRLNLPATCGQCHLNKELADQNHSGDVSKVESYFTSIHGWALARAGLTVSAVCTDCHGAHRIHRIEDPNSKVARANIPQTCSQCHLGVYDTYISSVHGRAFVAGNPDVPVCTSCHSEHQIQVTTDPNSTVYPTRVSQTCSACHENVALNLKYQLPTGRLKSYQKSFHGISSKLGDVTVANCASCHGDHDILPSTDPRSSISPKNLSKTCGKCHPQGSREWAIGNIHTAKRMEQHWIPRVLRQLYVVLIAVVIGGLVAFIAIDLYSRIKAHPRKKPDEPKKPAGGKD
jgi:nitrate/TMAO reductase-like tetraheme cytochrome c subunit